MSFAEDAALARAKGCWQRRARAGVCDRGWCLREIGNGNHEGCGARFVALTLPCVEARGAARNQNGDLKDAGDLEGNWLRSARLKGGD